MCLYCDGRTTSRALRFSKYARLQRDKVRYTQVRANIQGISSNVRFIRRAQMTISDHREIETVLAFFRKHTGRELDINISLFDGLIQSESMRIIEVGERGTSHYYI